MSESNNCEESDGIACWPSSGLPETQLLRPRPPMRPYELMTTKTEAGVCANMHLLLPLKITHLTLLVGLMGRAHRPETHHTFRP